jgi:hypothetical protein
MWQTHEREFSSFSEAPPPCVCYDDVPWPDISLLREINKCMMKRPTVQKREWCRDLTIRWHPDKFQQSFGCLLQIEDLHHIMQKVTQIFQIVNSFRSSGTRAT